MEWQEVSHKGFPLVIVVFFAYQKNVVEEGQESPSLGEFCDSELKGQPQDLGHRVGFLLVWGLGPRMLVPRTAGTGAPYSVLFLYLVPWVKSVFLEVRIGPKGSAVYRNNQTLHFSFGKSCKGPEFHLPLKADPPCPVPSLG